MRFLVDENLSPQLCALLTGGSDTAEHVRDAVGPGATDQQILAYALDHAAVIVTADTDFGGLLARGRMSHTAPSSVTDVAGVLIGGPHSVIVAGGPRITATRHLTPSARTPTRADPEQGGRPVLPHNGLSP